MSFPEPYAGLVIRYAYLWKREFDAGREEGTKDRPCAIVMTVVDEDGDKEVLVLPVTHSRPAHSADATYGPLPPRFFAHVRDEFLERDQREKSERVRRTE